MQTQRARSSVEATQRLYPWWRWPAEDFVEYMAIYRARGAVRIRARLMLPAHAPNLHQLARWRLNLTDDTALTLRRR